MKRKTYTAPFVGGSKRSKIAALVLVTCSLGTAFGQTSYTGTSSTGLWFSNRWNNSSDSAPYNSAFTSNNATSFATGTYVFTGGGTGSVGNITLADNTSVTFSASSGTWGTGGNVRTLTIGSGSILDLNGNSISTTIGTGFIKNGAGVFGTGAGNFAGGFTLNAGTVVARGTTGMGSGASNVLTLNGGTVASNATRSFDNTRFGGGIVIGGNVQFGELATNVSIASSSANIAFANNVALGGDTRTLTQGNNGTNTFSGVISNTSGGLTFAANSGTDGRFDITNAANTFTGDININGGEVRFTTDGSMGNAANDIIIDGGRFAKASDSTTVTLAVGRTISIGDGVGTGISSPGSGTLIYNGIIANKGMETGAWAKQGGGILELGGASTYTGSTSINNGILKLTTGNNRLPTDTMVSLGQAASANLGALDLNGQNQEVAGLTSVAGTNSGSLRNTITSATSATLTINTAVSTSHVFSAGTAANSGNITGLISLVKKGLGTQILGGANTYTGATSINAGSLIVNGSTGTSSAFTVASGATLGGSGTIGGATTIQSGGTLAVGNSPGTQSFSNGLTLASGSIFSWDLDANSVSGRGTNYDAVNVTGGDLTVTAGAVFRVVQNSGVDFDNTFWDLQRNFTDIFSITGGGSISSAWSNTAVSLFNTSGSEITSSRGSFTITGSNLQWTPVPEASNLLVGGLLGLGLMSRRRKQA